MQRPLVPQFVCPYGQDPDFIERTILEDLLVQRRPGSRHALVGGGGMGYVKGPSHKSCVSTNLSQIRKSQLAINYGYKIQQAAPDTWVFWVDAENVTKFEQGYRDIANAVRVTDRNDENADILSLVYDWLRNIGNANWVMILDNADDQHVFTSRRSTHHQPGLGKQIRDYLPQSSNGSILVTSRSRDAAFQVTCNYKHIFAVEPMTESEALALLQSQLGETHDEDEMRLLVETLGYVPLAITQAAANISRRSLPIRDYLQELKEGNETSASLLDENSPQLRRDPGRSNSIIATWQVTFEYVRRNAPSSARLLSLMCLFDRQDIPEALLQGQYGEELNTPPKLRKAWWGRNPRRKQRKKHILPVNVLRCDFEKDYLVLRDFSLIKLNKDRHHFSMHPIVQFTMMKWLVLHGEFDAYSHQFVSIMDANFHDPKEGALEECEPLLAHACAAIPYRPSDAAIGPLQIWAALTSKVARYYDGRVAWNTAQKLYRVAAEAFEISLGASASQALQCNTHRGCILSLMDRKAEAEAIHRRVLSLQCDSLGIDHPDTLRAMDWLGETLVSLNRHSEAEELKVQAHNTRIRLLGPLHDISQDSIWQRGVYLSERGRYSEAYGVWHRAHEARSQGEENQCDSKWADGLRFISCSLVMSGNLTDAERYVREAITEREKAPPGRDLIENLVQLAGILAEQEDYVEAEVLLQRAIEWYHRQATNEHPERLQAMSMLSMTLCKLYRLEDAEQVARQCLSERAEKRGVKHWETLESVWDLAGILEKQGQYDEALKLLEQAFESAKDIRGEHDDVTRKYQRDYAKLLQNIEETAVEETIGPESN